MNQRAIVLWALLIMALLPPTSGHAQSGTPSGTPPTSDSAELEVEARARFQLGQLYYSQARFAEAAAEFEAAYAIHPHPLLLHNVYLARRDLGDIRGAATALSSYLAAATDLSPADRRLLEGRLATMQRQLAEAEPEAAPEDPAVTEISDAEIAPYEELSDGTDLAAPEVPSGGLGLAPGAVVLGVGVAAMIGAAIAGGVAEGVRGERDGLCTLDGGACPASLDQDAYAARFAMARDAGWGLLVAGGVTAALGGVLLGVGASQPGEPTPVTAACDAHGCFAAMRGAF